MKPETGGGPSIEDSASIMIIDRGVVFGVWDKLQKKARKERKNQIINYVPEDVLFKKEGDCRSRLRNMAQREEEKREASWMRGRTPSTSYLGTSTAEETDCQFSTERGKDESGNEAVVLFQVSFSPCPRLQIEVKTLLGREENEARGLFSGRGLRRGWPKLVVQ